MRAATESDDNAEIEPRTPKERHWVFLYPSFTP
jgi:hypothetical protein